jgi:hypothetical protein
MSMLILAQVREAIARVDPGEAREAAERPVNVRLIAQSSGAYAAIEDFLIPRSVSRRKRFELVNWLSRSDDPGAPEQADLEIVDIALGAEEAPSGEWFVFDPEHPHALVRRILAAREELGLPLARCFPPFRRPVIERVIHSIARENAVFSLMTSLPNLAPNLSLPIEVPDISDTAFLTVNQVRMAFLLAAASDRPVGYREQRTEIAAIIAAGFGWRGLARWLGGRFSWGGGVVPRAAMAYAATYLVGLSLERLYRTGYGMTREERQLAYGDALARGRQVAGAVMQAWRDRQGERRYRQATRTEPG